MFVALGIRHAMRMQKLSKGTPRQAEVVLGVPGSLRSRIFSTFGTTRVVGRQPKAPASFTTGEIPGTHFQRLSRPQGTWFCRKEPRKKYQVAPPGIDRRTVRPIAQRLNHYATPGPRAGQATDENIIRRISIACWVTHATNILSEYVTRIALPQPKRE